MKVVRNEKTIQRNSKIGQYTSLGSLAVLVLGMYVSFVYPTYTTLSFFCLLLGFVGSQVGIYFGNRWGRHPRIDELLSNNLKGLTRDYTIYHYITPVAHLLIGPAGVWIIEPYYQRGTIAYEKGKWKQKGGGFLLTYLKIFAQEGLGRPDLEMKADIESLTDFFKKNLGEENLPEINSMMVFTDDRAELEPNDSPIPMLRLKEMKEFLRKAAKAKGLSAPDVKRLTDIFPEGVDEEK